MNEPGNGDRLQPQPTDFALRHRRVALTCAAFVAGMVGMSFAAVPFYNWLCRTTGYDGTPRIGVAAPSAPIERRISVRFDANVAPGLQWRFGPEQREINLKIGEAALAYYVAENTGSSTTSGIATYNVSPPQAGYYFTKLECFCFTEQQLAAGGRLEMPVTFYVDPEIDKDPDLKTLTSITLSYTFFPGKKVPPPLATTGAARARM
jgi:cytochrome c oxidase assembly protein subunit 11